MLISDVRHEAEKVPYILCNIRLERCGTDFYFNKFFLWSGKYLMSTTE